MNGSLNRIFRVVWNVVLGEWQVASEHTNGKGKTKSVRLGGSGFARLTAGSILVLCSAGALAELPTGGQVTAGSGQINTPSNGHMVINQNSNKMVIDWTSYSIGNGNSVQYIQPSADAIALNRVLGGDPSIIRGTISANGRVVLLNPNGILFGPTSKVEVASLLASTLNMSNEDFMAGNFNLTGNSTNSVINQGSIKAADGGFVALIAAKIENVGDIRVRGGEVLMGSGSKVRLDLGGPAKIEVDEAVIDGYIRNGGLIRAEGGSVVMTVKTAGELATLAINNEGIIEATSLARGDGGTIQLLADGGTVTNSGTLNASSADGKGGYVEVTGARVGILNGSVVDASGATGGGTVLLGGDYQGKNAAVTNARTTYIAEQAVIRANALKSGDGGKVVAWADESTLYFGRIEAKGGAETGNGGFVEVSGKKYLDFQGTVDTSAANGRNGTLLLDPTNLTIGNVGTSGWITNSNNSFGDFTTEEPSPAHDFSFLRVDVLLAALANNDITVLSACDVADCKGTITVLDSINWNSGKALTLDATGDIFINASINSTGAAGTKGGDFIANALTGNINVNANITTSGGAATIGGLVGGNVNLNSADGAVILANGVTINTGGSSAALGSNANGGAAGSIAINSTAGIDLKNGNLLAQGGQGDGTGAVGSSGRVSLLTTSHDITQDWNSRIVAAELQVKADDGSVYLDSGNNEVDAIAARADNGEIYFSNSEASGLTVTNIGSVQGVSAAGNIDLSARNLLVESDIASDAGSIVLNANHGQQSGDFTGVHIRDANVTTQNGNITIAGRGGDAERGSQNGVQVSNAIVSAGGTGAVVVTGVGGTNVGNGNQGVLIQGNGSVDSGMITSAGGQITVNATGGAGEGGGNFAVAFNHGGQIGATTGNRNVVIKTALGESTTLAYASDPLGGYIGTGTGSLTLEGDIINASGGVSGIAPVAVRSTGDLTVQSAGGSFASAFNLSDFAQNFFFNGSQNGLNSVRNMTIGRVGNTSDLQMNQALTLGNTASVVLRGGAVSLDQGITAGSLNIVASGDITQSQANGSFDVNAASLSSAGDITLRGNSNKANNLAATATGKITFDNGANDLNLNGTLSGAAVHLNAGSINQTGGSIATAALKVTSSSGGISLNQSNNVDTLAANASGNFSFNNAGKTTGALTIGTVDGTNGVTSTGSVTLNNIRDLEINQNINATNDSVTIAAAGGRSIDLGTNNVDGKLSLTDAEIDRINAQSLTLSTTGSVTNSASVRAAGVSAMTITAGQGIVRSGSGELGFSEIDNGKLTLTSTGTADGQGVGTSTSNRLITVGASELTLTSSRDIHVDARTRAGGSASANLDKLYIESKSAAASNSSFSVLSTAGLSLAPTTGPTWYRGTNPTELGTYLLSLSNTDALDFRFVGNAPIQVNASSIGAADFALQTTYGINVAGNITGTTGAISLKAGGSVGNYIGINLTGTSISTVDGSITLDGKGGTGQNTDQYSTQSNQYGVNVSGAGSVRATGTGSINITGHGGSTGAYNGTYAGNSDGVVIAGTARVSSDSGNIAITGTGGSGSGQASSTSDGIVLSSSATGNSSLATQGAINSNSGSVKLTGTGGSGINGLASSAITQSNGNITAAKLEVISQTSGWVYLTNNNDIGTLAGDVRTGFAFDNGGRNLIIGTVNNRAGFSNTSSSELGLYDIGTLSINESIEMASGTLKIAADTINIDSGKHIGGTSSSNRNVNVWLTGKADSGSTSARAINVGTTGGSALGFTSAILDGIYANDLTLATTGATTVSADTDFKYINQLTLSSGAISNSGTNYLILSGANNNGTLTLNGSSVGSTANAILARGANKLNISSGAQFNVEAYTRDSTEDLINLQSVSVNSSSGGASQTYRILGGGLNYAINGGSGSYAISANATGASGVNVSFTGNAATTINASSDLKGGSLNVYASSGNVTVGDGVAIASGTTNLRAGSSIAFNGTASLAATGEVGLRADGNGGSLTVTQGTISSTGNISISADDLVLGSGSKLSAQQGNGTISIDTRAEVTSGRTIQIGGASEAAGSLSITQAELERIEAANLIIGRNSQTYATSGAITLAGADLTNTHINALELRSYSGAISQTGALKVGALDVSLNSGAITLNNAGNDIDSFKASTTGAVSLRNTGDLEVKGVTSNGQSIDVRTGSNLRVTGELNATSGVSNANAIGGALRLDATGGTLTILANITSNGYAYASASPQQGGAISLNGQNVEIGQFAINSNGSYNSGGTGGGAGSVSIDATAVGGTITLDGTTINLTGGGGLNGAQGNGNNLVFNDAVRLASLTGSTTARTTTINAGGGSVTFNSTVEGGTSVGNNLTVTSSKSTTTTPTYGSVFFQQSVGAGSAIGNLTLTNVQNATLQSVRAAGVVISNQGATTLSGNLNTNGAGGININSSAISAAGGVGYTTTNNGHVVLATKGSLTLTNTSAFNSSGNIDLTADGGITLSGALMQTNGSGIIFRSATTLASDLAIDTTGNGAVETGGNVEFRNTLNSSGGARDLTITAGTNGNVVFSNQVGNTSKLDVVTINSANNVTTSNTFRATSFTQTDIAGTSTIGGATTLDGSFVFTGNALTVNQALIAANATVTNAGQFTTGSNGDLTVAGGFTQNGVGKSVLAGDINTTSTNISFASPVEFAGTMKLDTGTGAGNISFGGTLDSNLSNDFNTVTLNAGSGAITFGGDIGHTRAVGNLVINTTADVTLPVEVTARSLATNAGGSTILQNGATITTNGAQNYGDAVTLAGDATVIGTGNGNITFSDTVNGAHDLTVNTGGTTTFNGAIGNSAALASLSTNAGGTTVFNGGVVTTSGSQTYADNVQLGADTVFTSEDGEAIAFAGTVNSASTGNYAMTVDTSGTTTFNGAVGVSRALSSIVVAEQQGMLLMNGGSFKTTGAQTYNSGKIILGGDTTLQSTGAGAITLSGDVDAAICTIASLDVLTQGATVFGGAIGTYRPLWSIYTDGSATTPGNTVTFGQGTVITYGDQTYGELAILGSNTLLKSLGQGDITFNGPVRAAQDGVQSLTVDTSGDIIFNDQVGDHNQRLASFDAGQSIDGTVRINGGGINTSGTQVYRQQVALGNDAVLTGTTGTFDVGVDGNSNDLTLRFSGPTDLEGEKFVGVRNLTSDGAGVTNVSGTIETSGTQNYISNVVLASDSVLKSTGTGVNGDITLSGTVDGAYSLNINTAGTTDLAGAIGGTTALTSLTTDGPGSTTISGPGVRTTGTQIYNDAVQVTSNAVLISTEGGDVAFNDTVDGSGSLEVNTAGVTRFEGAVGGTTALASLTTDSEGSVEINGGSVRTVGAQSYGDAVTLGADTTLSSTNSGTIGFSGTLDGAYQLAIDTNGETRFDGVVGGTTALASLTTDVGGNVVINGSGITTTGDQIYGDAVEVATNTVLTSTNDGDITFRDTLDGPASVKVNTAGVTTFDKQVGGTTALASLATDAGGSVVINGTGVKTTGGQTYGDAVTLGHDAELESTANGNIVFAGTVDGPHELTVTTGGTTRFEDVVGGGTALAALSTGGTGTVNISGGSIHTTGDQTYDNAVVLAANTVLNSSNQGDVSFNSTLNGPYALSIETDGTTAFNGAVGGTSALASLTTDAGGEVLISGGLIRTSGAQTFNDGVTVGANTVFTSNGPITFNGTLDGPHDVTVRTPGVTTFGGAIGHDAPLKNLYGGTGAGSINIMGPSISLTGSLIFEEPVRVYGATKVNVGVDALFYGDARVGKSLLDVTAGGRIQYGRPVDNIKNYLPTLFTMANQQTGTRPNLTDVHQPVSVALLGNAGSKQLSVGALQVVDLTATIPGGTSGMSVGEASVNQAVNEIVDDESSRSTTYVVTVNGGVRGAEDSMGGAQ